MFIVMIDGTGNLVRKVEIAEYVKEKYAGITIGELHQFVRELRRRRQKALKEVERGVALRLGHTPSRQELLEAPELARHRREHPFQPSANIKRAGPMDQPVHKALEELPSQSASGRDVLSAVALKTGDPVLRTILE